MFSEIKEAIKYKSVIQNFVVTNLALRYRKSFLGYMWAVLAPMVRNLVIGVIYYYIARVRVPNYFAYMFLGAVFYSYIAGVINLSTGVFIANEHYIKKIYVPKLVYVLNYIFYELTNFVFFLVSVFILGMLFQQLNITVYALFIFVAIIIATIGLVGISIIVGITTVYFRDLQQILDLFLGTLYFVTPILVPASFLPRPLVIFNPMYYYVELFRVPVIEARLPDLNVIGICLGISLFCFFMGFWFLKKFNNRIVFKL